MARPSRCRRICTEPAYDSFCPEGISGEPQIVLTLDEYEVIRLIDLELLTHEQCAKRMDISRTTVTEIYESARHKLADCIVNGRPLVITGGNYRLCDGSAVCYCQKNLQEGARHGFRMRCAGERSRTDENSSYLRGRKHIPAFWAYGAVQAL